MPVTHQDVNTTAWLLPAGVVFTQNHIVIRRIAQPYSECNLLAQKKKHKVKM